MNKKQVYEEIKRKIISQEFAPEQVLGDQMLMDMFQIGRTPLRETLQELQREGLVTIVPRRGTFVTSLNLKDFQCASEIRTPLEELVADILVKRMTKIQLEQFESLLKEADSLYHDEHKDAVRKLIDLEAKLHNFLYDCTCNTYLIEVMKKLQMHSCRYCADVDWTRESIYQQFEDMRLLYDAILEKNSEKAKKCIHTHLEKHSKIMSQKLF